MNDNWIVSVKPVSCILYFNSMLIWYSSGIESIFKLTTITFGKYTFNWYWISCFRESILSSAICWNINALKLPPNIGFKYLSFLFVKK